MTRRSPPNHRAEVAERVADGKTNDVPTRAAAARPTRPGNVFTRINAILGVLLIIVLSPVR